MFRLLLIISGIVFGYWLVADNFPQAAFWRAERVWMPAGYEKPVRVSVDDDGRVFALEARGAMVDDILQEKKILIGDADSVFPDRGAMARNGETIIIRRAKNVTLTVGGETKRIITHQTDVEKTLYENGITLDEDDFILPKGEGVVTDGMKVSVVRVTIEEKIIEKAIPFEKKVQEDDKLSWRKTIVTQKGQNGTRRFVYKVSSHDGKEVDRKLVKQEVTQEPVAEMTTQGTYVAVGKAHTGLGTWYAYTGTLAAASPWLPMGSYVRVTNRDNGKQVIVKINDRGPFGKNRILDLDKVAFAKIASLGAGVINLKVEEIVN